MSKLTRSANMARIRGKNTKPEMLVRRCAHRIGLRFRLHCKQLPGSPDMVLAKYRQIIFIHGCFWHHHEGCARATLPKTNRRFWKKKILGNSQRDIRNAMKLREIGWKVLVIWECETRNVDLLARKLSKIRELPTPKQSPDKA